MQVTVNGERRELADGTSLPSLLQTFGLEAGQCVVERNGRALTRREAKATVLSDGDVLEVVRAVAGG